MKILVCLILLKKYANCFFIVPKTSEQHKVQIPAIEPPKPRLEVYSNQTLLSGAQISDADVLTIKIIPDSVFASNFPQDARYLIRQVEVWAQDADKSFSHIHTEFPQNKQEENRLQAEVKINIHDFSKDLTSGKPIIFKIPAVIRENYAGKEMPDERFSEHERTIALFLN